MVGEGEGYVSRERLSRCLAIARVAEGGIRAPASKLERSGVVTAHSRRGVSRPRETLCGDII